MQTHMSSVQTDTILLQINKQMSFQYKHTAVVQKANKYNYNTKEQMAAI